MHPLMLRDYENAIQGSRRVTAIAIVMRDYGKEKAGGVRVVDLSGKAE
jgi:hypothetical protein